MSYDQKRGVGGSGSTTSPQGSAATPGKRTLTERLPTWEAAKGATEQRVEDSVAGGAAANKSPASNEASGVPTSTAPEGEGTTHAGTARVAPVVNIQVGNDAGAGTAATKLG